jgi:hypothetical protein
MRNFFRFAFVVTTLLAVTGCGEQEPPAAPEVLERKSFAFDGVAYELQLPVRGRVYAAADSVRISDFSTRAMQFIEFKKAQDDPGGNRKHALKNGHTLTYRVDYDLGGGSGGTEGELVGRMEIGGHALLVTCRDQKKGRPEPEWCFPYLGTLAIVASPR